MFGVWTVWHPAFIYIVPSNKWWWHFYWEFKLHSVRIIDVRYSICITLSISSHLSQSRPVLLILGRGLWDSRLPLGCQNNTGLFLMQNIVDKWQSCLLLKIASDYNWKAEKVPVFRSGKVFQFWILKSDDPWLPWLPGNRNSIKIAGFELSIVRQIIRELYWILADH